MFPILGFFAGNDMSPDLIDQAILAACKPKSLKVMRIISDVAKALELPIRMVPGFADLPDEREEPRGRYPELDLIVDRIKALVKAKMLESAGHLDWWRNSEIRLTGK
jgi:hypothetical protein